MSTRVAARLARRDVLHRRGRTALVALLVALPVAGMVVAFVLQRTGTFEGGQAKESYSVVQGSGSGDLQGIRGEGSSAVGHGMEHPFTLSYEL